MTPAAIRREAQAFVIWREGHAVKWDCSVAELSHATGIAHSTVSRICEDRGWPVERGGGERISTEDLSFVFGRLAHQHRVGLSVQHG